MRALLVVSYLFLALLCVVPVVLVTGDSFLSGSGGLTLDHYAGAFGTESRWTALGESLLLGAGATIFAILLGVPYALFSCRIRVPGRAVFSALYVLPLVLPPLLMAMGWKQFLDAADQSAGDSTYVQIIGGVRGSALLLGLAYFPFVVLFARKAFLEIGAGLEEAARVHAGPVRSFFRVTLPLAAPGILAGSLFVFLFSFGDFAVCDFLSTVKGLEEKISTYSFVQFGAWKTSMEPTIGRREAAALGTPVVLFTIFLVLAILWLHRKGSMASITSGHVRPGYLEDHSRPGTRVILRAGGFLFMALVLLLSVGVPLGRLVHEALGNDGDLIAHMRQALGSEAVPQGEGKPPLPAGNGLPDLLNSLEYSALAAAMMTLLAAILAHHAVRRGPRREGLVLALSFLPMAVGGIALGAGLIRTWNQTWLEVGRYNPVYESEAIVVLMLVGKYLPFALAAIISSLKRVDPGLEEAAAVSGVGPGRRLVRVMIPLTAKGLAAGFVLGFVFSMRELETTTVLDLGSGGTLMKKIYQFVHFGVGTNEACLSLLLVMLIALPFLLYSLLTAKKVRVL